MSLVRFEDKRLKWIIFALGTNDIHHHAPRETAAAIKSLTKETNRVFPEAKIEFLAPFVSQSCTENAIRRFLYLENDTGATIRRCPLKFKGVEFRDKTHLAQAGKERHMQWVKEICDLSGTRQATANQRTAPRPAPTQPTATPTPAPISDTPRGGAAGPSYAAMLINGLQQRPPPQQMPTLTMPAPIAHQGGTDINGLIATISAQVTQNVMTQLQSFLGSRQ
jgi:hypothetical protein